MPYLAGFIHYLQLESSLLRPSQVSLFLLFYQLAVAVGFRPDSISLFELLFPYHQRLRSPSTCLNSSLLDQIPSPIQCEHLLLLPILDDLILSHLILKHLLRLHPGLLYLLDCLLLLSL